jgi:phosphatidylinositol kinase/protein kinase (PI-3  family)
LSNNEAVPFRLGLNLQKFFNGLYTVGVFNGALTASTLAIGKKNRKDNLTNVINLMFRDEANDAINTTRTDLSVHELTRRNTQAVLQRLDDLMPPVRAEQPLTTTPINAKITELIESATNKANLANMDISWQPWL